VPILGGPITEAPRAVIFDIGRVIVRVNLARSVETLGGHKGLSHEQALRELQADPHWRDWQEGRIAPQDWHKHICEKFHLSIGFDDFCRIWNSVLDPVPILPELLFARLAKSCRLALLSNTDAIHVAHMEATFPFVRHFPVRVYSCHVGASKPAPLIYHHALREIDALPEEAMFIDDVRENAVAAASLGITAFHFTSAEELLAEFSHLGLWTR
jgi:FMN phosphatase YigB (HAD superfamily)